MFPTGLLLLILLVSFCIRVINLNYNSPFLDEAIYQTLGKQVLAWQWQVEDPYAWVGGNPLFYPTLSAIFSFFGGIVGSRFLSVVLGTFSIYLMYLFAKKLHFSKNKKTNEIIGLLSSAFLGVLAMPIFLSRWAIYDMLSFTLFLYGLVLLQRAIHFNKTGLWEREGKFLPVAFVFFLSFLAKYITLILFPIVILWAIYLCKQRSIETFSVSIRYFVIPLILALSIYFFQNMTDLIHFQSEQVSTTAYSMEQIFRQYLAYALPGLVIALGGLVLLLLKKQFLTPMFLFIAAAVVPVVHIITNNYASVHQHAYLSLIFFLPLGAYFFSKVIEKQKLFGSLISVCFITFIFFYSQSQVRQLENMWTNTNDVMTFLKENTSSHERLLSTEGDVAAAALNNIKNENIIGYYSFQYKTFNNTSAYSTAINESYFDYILVDEHNESDVSKTVKDSITSHYTPLYNKHPFTIYKKGI